MMPQDIPATCDGCGNKFSIKHALSCPKGTLVLARHDDAAKEWGAIGSQVIVPSAITYEPKINSRTIQGGGGGGGGARQEGGEADGGTEKVVEAQGVRARTVNGASRLVGKPGQVVVPAELRADISAHSFWKRGTTTMFDIQISNHDSGKGSYKGRKGKEGLVPSGLPRA